MLDSGYIQLSINADDHPRIGLFGSCLLFRSASALGPGAHLPRFHFDTNNFVYATCVISWFFNIYKHLSPLILIGYQNMRTRQVPASRSDKFQRSFGQSARFRSNFGRATKWDYLVLFRPTQSVKIRPIPHSILARDSIEIPGQSPTEIFFTVPVIPS